MVLVYLTISLVCNLRLISYLLKWLNFCYLCHLKIDDCFFFWKKARSGQAKKSYNKSTFKKIDLLKRYPERKYLPLRIIAKWERVMPPSPEKSLVLRRKIFPLEQWGRWVKLALFDTGLPPKAFDLPCWHLISLVSKYFVLATALLPLLYLLRNCLVLLLIEHVVRRYY